MRGGDKKERSGVRSGARRGCVQADSAAGNGHCGGYGAGDTAGANVRILKTPLRLILSAHKIYEKQTACTDDDHHIIHQTP